MRSSRLGVTALAAAALLAALAACSDQGPTVPSLRAAKGGGGTSDVTVTATDPDSATQDTTLDVVVNGSGFDNGSVAQWAINGVPASKVQTNSTTYVNPKKLVANITIAADADTGFYDVVVTASTGKKGIGSELFVVRAKGSGRNPSDQPDPVLAFLKNDNVLVMTATGSNVTTVYDSGGVWRPPSWSPFGNGTFAEPYRLVFETDPGSCPLSTIDIDTVGGVVHASNLQPLPTPGYWACSPAWSPVADTIAFGGGQPNYAPSGVFLISATGGPVATIYSATPPNDVFWLAWRSTGDAIAFTEWNTQEGGTAIRVLNRVTGVVTTVVDSGEFGFSDKRGLSWARTRDVLAFGAYKNRKWETDTLRLARDAQGNFVRAANPAKVFNDFGPSWSPDDSHLALNGITVLDLVSGKTQNLVNGVGPNWRR